MSYVRNYQKKNCNEVKAKWRTCPVGELAPVSPNIDDIVQLPNWVLGVKRVLGYGKRFIVDYVTWTCPEPKSAGCPLGTLDEFFYSQNKMAPFRYSYIVKNTTLVLIMGGYLGKIALLCAKQHQCYIISL